MPKDSHYNDIKIGDTVLVTSNNTQLTGSVTKITNASIIIQAIVPRYSPHSQTNYRIWKLQPQRKDIKGNPNDGGANMNITKIPFSMYAEHAHSLGIDVEELVEEFGINDIKNVY